MAGIGFMSQLSIIKQHVNKLMELLNENGICSTNGKVSSQNTQQESHSLVNSTFAERNWIKEPSNSHVIGCKWVYKVKLNANGTVERYKAQLVAKGYNQVAGLDYQETFSPVAKHTTVRKQPVVARSSAEAKYRCMASTCCEVVWLKHLLSDFGIECIDVVILYSDSQSAIHINKNPVFHERTKHIELDCHFIKKKVLEGIIKPMYMSTNLQLADMFTKALTPR
ncbi:Uncharacterized protein TCM_045138 [Theobroma cacao]|uniref:Reverse transcriptase Ty1/copia-type domain-containing protein n=1 Tax=Theobroma cacao TaxID=3641 RepID=A0A061FSC8_THECC|nr:Uncharacterized protein TCM_045138 [Theobroma cacao]